MEVQEELAISMLEELKELAKEIEEGLSVDSAYWEEEEALVKDKIEQRENELYSISMSSDKFHKSFSL